MATKSSECAAVLAAGGNGWCFGEFWNYGNKQDKNPQTIAAPIFWGLHQFGEFNVDLLEAEKWYGIIKQKTNMIITWLKVFSCI